MATKEAYQQKLAAQLGEWDARLDVLSARAHKASAELRINYENDLEVLKARQAAARKTLEDMGKRGENAWEDMKEGTEQAWRELGQAVERVAARFK